MIDLSRLEDLKRRVQPTRDWVDGAYVEVALHPQAMSRLLAYIDALERAVAELSANGHAQAAPAAASTKESDHG